MRSRRTFIQRSGLLALGMFSRVAVPQQQPNPAPLPKGIGTEPDFDGPIPSLSGELGKYPALKAEQQTARTILGKAPTRPSPIAVAEYFVAVGRGDYGDDWKPYIMGWPERWNPVIVTFFQATNTNPEGDLTSWCAAFLNWCFQQTTGLPATKSASSGSFRQFGQKTASPQKGDIVVFKSTDVAQASAGHGHVGFFVQDYGDAVEVLGGNQIDGRARSHMINSKRLAKNGPNLVLHSYRSQVG
ncbi:MAG TPA: CHAP domain-containing protein [Terracidiphilus sp.]